MDKKKLAAIMAVSKDIQKSQGEGAVFSLGSVNENATIPRFDTMIDDLNAILGGGMPWGRIIEISGPEASGKTSLAYHLLGLMELGVYIAAEGTFEADRAKVFGNRPKQLLIVRPDYGEQALDAMLKYIKAGVPMVVLDSVPFLIPKTDYETAAKDPEKPLPMGGTARLLSKMLPVINNEAEKSGTIVIFINQVRDAIGGGLFGPQTQTMGGRFLKHVCSARISVARRKWIQVPNKNPATTELEQKVGLVTKCKTIKSKISNPFQECELPMMFDVGYISHDDVVVHRKRLMEENRTKYK